MQLLLEQYHSQFSGPFIEPDSRALYEKNLAVQGEDWPWRNRSVYYQLNSQGYRCPEWDSIRWESSVVFFGCSQTYGIGLDQDQTIPCRVQSKLGQPCVNLARAGTSIMFQWANTVRLVRAGIKPRAVVYIWPDHARVVHFLGGHFVHSIGSWSAEQDRKPQLLDWITDLNQSREWADLAIKNCQLLWTCPVLDYTFQPETARLGPHLLPHDIDRARDLEHPGVQTAEFSADIIAQSLRVQLGL
jgi:hypothetical protein